MSMKLDAWGFLPVFYGRSNDQWGRASGPFVKLPAKHGPELVAHEVFHVKQWYLWNAIPFVSLAALSFGGAFIVVPIAVTVLFAVLWRLPKLRVRREVAAYGESLRVLAPTTGAALEKHIQHYAVTLDTSEAYSYENESLENLKDMIRARFKDGWLF